MPKQNPQTTFLKFSLQKSWTKRMLVLFLLVFLGLILIIPSVPSVYAQLETKIEERPTDGCADTEETVTLKNPLTGKCEAVSPIEIYGRIIKGFLGVTGTLSLVIFIYGGLVWLTSGGNAERVKKGRDTLVWAILGIAVTFGSYAILQFVIKAFIGAGVP